MLKTNSFIIKMLVLGIFIIFPHGIAFAADGDLIWSSPSFVPGGWFPYANPSASALYSGNLYTAGSNGLFLGTFYGVPYAGGMVEKRDASTGTTIWTKNIGQNYPHGIVADETGVYVTSWIPYVSGNNQWAGGFVQKLSHADGSIIWSHTIETYGGGGVTIGGGGVFVIGENSSYKLDRTNGQIIWSKPFNFLGRAGFGNDIKFDGNTSVYIAYSDILSGSVVGYLEKRNTSDGSLVWGISLGANKVVTSLAVNGPTADIAGLVPGNYWETSPAFFERRDTNGNLVFNFSGPSGATPLVISNSSALFTVDRDFLTKRDSAGAIIWQKATNYNPSGYAFPGGSGPVMSAIADETAVYFGTATYDGPNGASYPYRWLISKYGSTPACAANQGASCSATSPANACGQTNTSTGTIQCNGTCSVSQPSPPSNPSGYGSACSSSANACGQTSSGTIQCDGSCSASAPANPANYGTSCSSTANACGQTSSGTINCSGACTASTPANPSGYGSACTLTSPANACGQTATASGTIGCSGACTGTTPSAPPNSNCSAPTVTVSVTPSSVVSPNPFTVSMTSSADVRSCTWTRTGSYSGNWTDQSVPAPNTSYNSGSLAWPAGNATWSFTCTNAAGRSSTASGSVLVTAPTCTNGATNPTACTQCPDGQVYDTGTNACTSCSNGGCSGTPGGTPSNPSGGVSCNNGALNPPSCSVFTPTASLSANPSTVDSGQSTRLYWSSTNTTSCTSAGGFSTGGATNSSSGVQVGPLTQNPTNYSITCTGPGGSVNANTSIAVLEPDASISADPLRVTSGSTSTITWSASQVTSCSITGPGVSSSSLTGSRTPTITAQSTYTITCQTNGTPISRSVTVNIRSLFQEF